MSPWRKSVWRAVKLSGLAVACTMTGPAAAQQMVQRADIVNRGGAVNPENFDAKDSAEGVYAPESTTAMDTLARAANMERQKAWGNAASYYQDLLTKPEYASKVVPSRQDTDHRIYQYSSVAELVMQRLSRWPQEGLDVYRARYGAEAAALLDSAKPDDLFTLQQVFTRYFVTESGKAAGIRLIDHELETGEFRAAASIGDRLLKWHPNILAERAALLYRVAIADHLAGNDADARARLDALRKQDPQAKAVVRGKDVVLAESLAQELKHPAPVAIGSTADSYTTFGGNWTRNDIVAGAATPGAHLYSIDLSRPTRVNGPQAQMLEAHYKDEVRNGITLGVMPVIDRGELFFQDGQRIYGVNLESGVPLPGWQQTHGAEHDGAYTLPNVTGSPRTHQLTLTVTDHAVLAVMGQPDADLLRIGMPPQGQTRLVCLDRQTGKENWIVTPGQLKQASLKTLEFSGSPLVVGDNVLLAATTSKQAGFEDCYVLCFDLAGGTLRWFTNVASASTIAAAWARFNPNIPSLENEVHLAYANGRVYVQSNRGAVAALDAYNGTIDWLDIYPRGQQGMADAQVNPMFFQPGQFPQNQTKPWAFNPVIVSQGMVFTLPLEGKNLLIYDASSGTEVKRIDLGDLAQRLQGDDIPEKEEFDTLAGVVGDKLVIVGTRAVVALNWKTYDGDHYDDQKMLFWDALYPQPVRGRPFLTQQSLYLPMEDRLYQLNLTTGKADKDYPKWPRTWGDDEGPGNVLATSDHMVIAGADHVDVYTDLAAAKAKLDRQVAEAPNDPQPRLRYAEVMYAAGDYDTSLAKLDEAIDRLGGPKSMQPGPVRDRVFNDALTFAQKLKADDRPDSRARVDKLFDRAAEAALSPEQKVQYAMGRAKFDELKNDPPAALALYQQVLADPATRAVPLPDEAANTPASADVIARKQIAELIRKDPQIYEPFEKEAAAALQQAQESKDPARLLEVAQVYPNSTVAPKAMLAAADAYESAGDNRTARHVLSDIYFDHNTGAGDKPAEWAQILEAMARTDPQTAPRMLSRGIAELHDPKLTKPLKLSDGTEVAAGTPFSGALEKVRKVADRQQALSLPTFRLPVPQEHKPYPKPFLPDAPVIANVDALAMPLRDFARPDRIVTWSTAPLLAVYAPGSDKPLATTAQLPEEPKGCAWIDKDLLVWGPTQLVLLKADGAESVWKMDVSRLPTIDVIAAGPQPENIAAAGNMANPRNVRMVGRAMIVRNGVLMPAVPQPAPPKPVPGGPEQIDQVLPVGDRILLSTTTGRLLSLEKGTGHLVWQTRLTDRPVDRLLGDEDFTVVKAENDQDVRLAVLDTYTGHVRGTQTFARESNNYPQNVALSPDGTLVYTLPDRICLKDLYKPWGEKPIEKLAAPGQASFAGLTGADQLVISEGRILALTDSGAGERAGEKFVRLYSLETGEPIMLNFADGQQVERALSIGSKSPDTSLHVVGPRVYVIAPDAAICYDLANPDDHYSMFDQENDGMSAQACFIGQDYLILLNDGSAPAPADAPAAAAQPAAPQSAVSPSYNLYAFSRATRNGKESGRLDYSTPISDPAGVTASWQAIDGGLVYLTADHKLHMLLGAGK